MSDRDEDVVKNDLLGRRSYLAAAGSVLGFTALSGPAQAAGDSYDVVEVPPNETFTKRLSPGETWENVLIDITADGAGYDIVCKSSGVTIRNIGVRGQWDHDPGTSPFRVETTDPNGTIVIENVYLGDGTVYDPSNVAGRRHTGIYVYGSHAGDIEINRVNIQGMMDNGIYASSPGHPAGTRSYEVGGGTTRVHDSYLRNNQISGIRLGTSGSYAENCVIQDHPHRGVWAYYENTEYIDCDIANNRSGDVVVGNSNNTKGHNAEATMTNSRWETESSHGNNNVVNGTSVGTPTDRVPEGCPTSPEEAAAGLAGSDGSSSDGTSDTGPYTPTGSFDLAFTTSDSLAEYLVELDADSVQAGEGANTREHEYQDRAFQQDGKWYIHGYTGGGTDDFTVENGEILRVGQLQGSVTATADGRTVDLSAFETITAVPDETPGPSGSFDLAFTTSDSLAEYLVELDADSVQAGEGANTREHEYQDRAFQQDGKWYIHGYTGGGTDDFAVENGEVLRVGQLQGSVTVTADGGELDLAAFDTITEVPATGGDTQSSAIVIDGSGTDDVSAYRFSVSGTVERDPDLTTGTDAGPWDTVEDEVGESSVVGVVDDGTDGYRYTGEITELRVRGDATVDRL